MVENGVVSHSRAGASANERLSHSPGVTHQGVAVFSSELLSPGLDLVTKSREYFLKSYFDICISTKVKKSVCIFKKKN